MAKTVDILRYVLGLDAKPFRSEARKVTKDVRKLRGGVDKSAKSFGGLKTAVVAAAAALAALKLAGLIKDATLVAARIEVLNNVFELTGKAAGITGAELEFTKQKLIALGIAEKEALQIGLRFIQVQLDLADSLKIARAAQDLAVVAGTDSSTTALALTNAIVKQRPILLKQFGIVANLDEIFGKMAKTLGKTVKELTENERRTAFLNTILEKAKTVAGSYEKAMELVGKRLTSLPRHFQNAQKAVGQHFLPAMRVAVDGTADFLKAITSLFSTLDQGFTKSVFAFAKGFDKFAENVPKIRKLRQEFEALTTITTRTEPQQAKLNKVIKELGDLLPEVRTTLKGYATDLFGVRVAIDAAIDASLELQKFRLLDVLGKQSEAFELNLRKIEAFKSVATDVFGVVELSIEGATKRVERFRQALGLLIALRDAVLFNINAKLFKKELVERSQFDKLDKFNASIAGTGAALRNANREVARYQREVKELEETNAAMAQSFAQLFPNLKENAFLLSLVSEEYRHLIDAAIAFQATQGEGRSFNIGLTTEEMLAVGDVMDKLAQRRAAALEREIALWDEAALAVKHQADATEGLGVFLRELGLDDKARARALEREIKLWDKVKKQTEQQADLAKELLQFMEELGLIPKTFTENMQDATRVLDLVAEGLSGISDQMSGLVSSAADFTAALASGDLLSKIGAGIGLAKSLFGALGSLFGGGGESQAEADRKVIESRERNTEALEALTRAFISSTIGEQSETVKLLQRAFTLIALADQLRLESQGGDLDKFRQALEVLAQANEILAQLGLSLAEFGIVAGKGETLIGGESALSIIEKLLRELGLSGFSAQAFLQPFDRPEGEGLDQMLTLLGALVDLGQLTGQTGLDLINFWKRFGDLSLEQERELLERLLFFVERDGNITDANMRGLRLLLKELTDQIAAEAAEEAEQAEQDGLTQIQRSVTTITEGQANLLVSTLNSILAVMTTIDDRIFEIVKGLFSEPGGLLAGAGGVPLVPSAGLTVELPGVLASLQGIEDSLGSFLDRVAENLGPIVTVQAGGVVITQNFPAITERKEVEDVTAAAITEALITDGRARGVKI